MKLRLTPAAEADVREIYRWYRSQGGSVASDFRSSLDASFDQIGQAPFALPKVHRDMRRALLRRFPYGVFYTIESGEVVVLAVLHGSRDPGVWKERHIRGP